MEQNFGQRHVRKQDENAPQKQQNSTKFPTLTKLTPFSFEGHFGCSINAKRKKFENLKTSKSRPLGVKNWT